MLENIKKLTYYNLLDKLKVILIYLYNSINNEEIETLSKRVIVKEASQLLNLDSTKEYFIDGEIIISSPIVVPEQGLIITGYGTRLSKIKSATPNLSMFIHSGTGAGDLNLNDVSIEVTGANSKVFAIKALTGNEAIEFTNTNFENCTSRGYIEGYRQGLENNVALFGGKPDLQFRGVWTGGFRITNFLVRDVEDGVYSLFSSNIGQVFNSRFGGNPNIELPLNVKAFTFAENNFATDALLQIEGANFQGQGAVFGNINETNIKVKVRTSVGVERTSVGGFWTISSETQTTFSGSNTYTKVLGTKTFDDLVWFSNGGVNNALQALSGIENTHKVYFVGSFLGANNTGYGLKIRQWDASSSSYIDLSETFFTTNGGAGGDRAENVSTFTSYFKMNQGDRIELWLKNIAGTAGVTLLINSRLILEET